MSRPSGGFGPTNPSGFATPGDCLPGWSFSKETEGEEQNIYEQNTSQRPLLRILYTFLEPQQSLQ